jgi:hypothetical protein
MKKSMRKKLKPGNIVMVQWADICGDFNTQLSEVELTRVVSFGMVHDISTHKKSGLEQLKLNACVFECEYEKYGLTETEDPYGDIISIPLSVILKVDILVKKPKLFE